MMGLDRSPGIDALVVGATLAVVVVSVLLHYTGFSWLIRAEAGTHVEARRRVLYVVLAALVLHCIEIWLFGLTLYFLVKIPACGALEARGALGLLDYVYFSGTTYTTVGYGDIEPVGPIRFLAGMEALAGLVLITWSASFTYLQMERFWPGLHRRSHSPD